MPLVRQIKSDTLLLGIWNITESADELSVMYYGKDMGVCRDHCLKGEQRRLEWFASRLLVRELLGQETLVAKHQDGAPYIVNSSLYLSISHTNGYAVVAVADKKVGVDVELITRSALRASSRFMNDNELSALENDCANIVSLLHWSAKEALFKVVGNLGGTFKDNITVAPFEIADCGSLKLFLHGVNEKYAGEYNVDYMIDGVLLLTLCGESFLNSDSLS